MVARFAVMFFCCASAVAVAAEPSPSSSEPAGNELKTIQHMLEQQSEQIDVLAQEVARLNLLLEGRKSGELPPPSLPAQEVERATPTATAPAAPAAEKPAPPPAGGLTHEVLKGETLTSIAKHYKVTVGELLKVNKIADVKRLQIGQTVNLPPDAKAPDAATATAPPSPSPTK